MCAILHYRKTAKLIVINVVLFNRNYYYNFQLVYGNIGAYRDFGDTQGYVLSRIYRLLGIWLLRNMGSMAVREFPYHLPIRISS